MAQRQAAGDVDMRHRSNLGKDEMDCSSAFFVRSVFAVQHPTYTTHLDISAVLTDDAARLSILTISLTQAIHLTSLPAAEDASKLSLVACWSESWRHKSGFDEPFASRV
jgi:hypothetical protein